MTPSTSKSSATTVIAKVAFDVHFDHSQLDRFVTASPEERAQWREELDSVIYGDQQDAVQRLFTGTIGMPVLPTDPNFGNVEAKQIQEALSEFVLAYNAVQTGISFSLEGDVPTCVRYEWIDGKRLAIYNYSLAVTGDDVSASGRPDSTYHATLVYELTV